jgi:hypothetical protein
MKEQDMLLILMEMEIVILYYTKMELILYILFILGKIIYMLNLFLME